MEIINEERKKHIPEEASFLWESCLTDREYQFSLQPGRAKVLAPYFPEGFLVLESFRNVQGNCKKRRLNNGKRSRTNQAKQYVDKFYMRSGFGQASMARAFNRPAINEPCEVKKMVRSLEPGIEDMPDAFRSMPTMHEQLRHIIVMVNDRQDGSLWFFRMHAALFGEGSAVYAFATWGAFLGAARRRTLFVLLLMCVDDGSLVDLQAAEGEGRAVVNGFFYEIGAPLCAKERILFSKH